MGGCRCSFRKCENNSSNAPLMHFFHFPVNTPERCRLWERFAGRQEEFAKLRVDKLKNKVVCEEHFQDESFMNYKKDRLIKSAVPTLVRLGNNMVLDYSQDDEPTPIRLEPSKRPHLIPPKKAPQEEKREPQEEKRESQEEKMEPQSVANVASCSSATVLWTQARKPPTIQLSEAQFLEIAGTQKQVIKMCKKRPHVPQKPECTTPKRLKIKGSPKVLNTRAGLKNVSAVIRKIPKEDNNFLMLNAEDSILVEDDPIFETENTNLNCTEVQLLCEDTDFIAQPTPDVSQFQNTIDTQKKKIDELLALVEEQRKENQIAKESGTTQVGTITTSLKSHGTPAASLTKVQLFNGIKKYVSPSMIALVRMEMFGQPDRPWKPDEKNVAAELLQLGDNVFNYVRDEWRFRLPPKKEVEKWLTENRRNDDDEEP